MLDQFRAQKIEWNRANNQIYDRVETSSGDSNGRTLFVQISNGGTVEDLTGATLSLAWSKRTEQGLETFEEVDAKKGQYRLFYPTGMLVNHGVLQASLVLVDVTGRIESKPFDIIVHKGTVDDEAVESDNKFTALTTALVKVSQVQAEFDGLYADKSQMMDTLHDDKKADMEALEADYSNRANTLEATYAPRLTEVSAQLAQKASKAELDALGELKLTGSFATLTNLQTSHPTGAEGLFLVIDDGFVYRWNGTNWTQAAQFQSTGIAEDSITPTQTNFIKGANLFGGSFEKKVAGGTPRKLFDHADGRAVVIAAKNATYQVVVKGMHNNLMIGGSYSKNNASDFYTIYEGKSADKSDLRVFFDNAESYPYIWIMLSTIAEEPYVYLSEGISFEIADNKIENITPNAVLSNWIESPLSIGANKFTDVFWTHGGISGGTEAFVSNRLFTYNFVEPLDDMFIKLLNNDTSYRYSVHEYTLDNVWTKDSGWLSTDQYFPYDANKKYKIVLSKASEIPGETVNIESMSKNIIVAEGRYSIGEELLSSEVKTKLNAEISLTKTSNLFDGGVKYVGIANNMTASPANSLQGIRQSKLAGAWGVEMDLRLTADNDIVLCHNELLADTVNAPEGVYVYEKTVAEIKQYDYLDSANYSDVGVKIPTLDEALAECKKYDLIPFLDLKDLSSYENTNSTLFYDLVVAKIKSHRLIDTTVIISTSESALKYFRSKLPSAWLSCKRYIQNTTVESDITFAENVGGNVLMQIEPVEADYPLGVVTKERIEQYHSKGYPVKDFDFIFTYQKINDFKDTHKFSYSFKKTGADWEESDFKAAISNVDSTQSPLGVDCLYIKPNNLNWNELRRLNPAIYVDGLLTTTTTANAVYYDKKILVTFQRDGSVVSPTTVSNDFKLNVVF